MTDSTEAAAGEPSAALIPVRAKPRTAGTHFLGGPVPADHRCKAACYRVSRDGKWIFTVCDYGHSAGGRETGPRSGFAGSKFAADLNELPAFAPFVLVPAGVAS
jgi:hypothetical protein